MLNTVIHGDCLEKLKQLESNSIDAIVTDPPYELGFMGKKWDSSGIAYNVELWQEALRVLKPGGHLLAFGGSRTYHRMAVAIEDAGFEVRDMLEWIYASGFPKSLNVGKAVDKLQGNERVEVPNISADGRNRGAEPSKGKVHNPSGMVTMWERTAITTKGTSEYEGFGTALKPAHEPIIMARKPLAEKTIVANVLKYGTGAIDIDGCRIPAEPRSFGNPTISENGHLSGKEPTGKLESTQGRFPANIICTDDALNDGVMTKSGWQDKHIPKSLNNLVVNFGHPEDTGHHFSDSGSKSRYFDIDVWAEKHGLLQYPKASKSERNAGCEELKEKTIESDFGSGDIAIKRSERVHPKMQNHHPTVKPIQLMSWLIRLISKEGDTVLDPFGGSGTTGVACKLLNRNFVLIEREKEYIDIINARIDNHRNLFSKGA